MASKLVRTGLIKNATGGRRFAAQAAAKPSDYGVLPKEPLKSTTLSNGVLVASVENQSPLSRVCIAIRAGSRYETLENRGASHLLRIAAGLSNKQNSAFGLTRNLQQMGSSLVCTGDREALLYTVEATRNNIEQVMELLANAVTQQVFKPWEIQDNKHRALLDLQLLSPEVAVMEDLHQAAYRQSDLSHGLFVRPHLLGALGPDQLASHLAQTLLSRRTAVLATGMHHDTLVEFSQALELPDGQGPSAGAQYGGGEVRTETGGQVALVAVAAEGAGAASPAQTVVQAVLQAILGAGPVAKYGSGRGLLGTAAATEAAAAAASAINVVYSDNGLMGYFVACEAAQAGKVVEAVNRVFRTSSISADDVNRGKALVKAALLRAEESSGSCLESMASQAITTGAVSETAEAVKAVDAVKLSDVQTLHKKLVGGKLSMACRGNLANVPYLDHL